MKKYLTARFAVAAFLTLAAASGATLGIAPTGVLTGTDPRAFTTGWEFTVSTPILITALGYLDWGGDGLLTTHDVGIFTTGGVLLVSTTVPSGTAGTLSGGYRFAAIPAFELAAGTYIIGGQNPVEGADPAPNTVAAWNPAPGITMGATDLYAWGPILAFPNLHAGTLQYAAPNFEFDPVPEPMSILLVGSALAGLGLGRLISRRRS